MFRRFFVNCSLACLTVVIFLALLEGGARILHAYKRQSNEYEILIEQQGIAPTKDKNEKRVFIVGESAARGVPYSLEYSVSGFLQELMKQSGNGHVGVINTSIPGRHSFYEREEAKTLIRYKADAVIIYAGNNDTRDFSNVMRDVPLALLDFKLTWNSDFYAGFKRKVMELKNRINKAAKKKVFEINYNQDDVWHWTRTYLEKKKAYLENSEIGMKRKEQALKDFEENLDVLVRKMKAKNIHVFIANLPVVHESLPQIGDWSRKGYEFDQKVQFKNEQEKIHWNDAFENGKKELHNGRFNEALVYFQEALATDQTYPLLFHYMGDTYRNLGNFQKAKELYVRAKDIQIQSVAGDSLKNAALKRIRDRRQVYWVDLQDVLEKSSPGGIVGQEFFLDSCHANLLGNKIMAARMMESLCGSQFISCPEGQNWQAWLKLLVGGEMNSENTAREYLLVAFYKFKGTAWEPAPLYNEAILYLEKARAIAPHNKNLYPLLAASYWQVGQKDDAYKSLKTLYELNLNEYQKTLKDFPYLIELKVA